MTTLDFPATLLHRLRHARHIAVLTGAGISAESGIPTFRDAQTGLWAKYDPLELATPQAFQRNPRLVWDWYAWRRQLVAHAQPNAGHQALVAMQRLVPQFTLITQNVDGLHQQAGNTDVIELHGNIRRIKRADDGVIVTAWTETEGEPVRCPQTGSLLRPDVVWFGEMLPPDALDAARVAARTCDVFFSIGTSGLVEPAASLPRLALHVGATLVVVNPEATLTPRNNVYLLQGAAGVILPQLVAAVWGGGVTPDP